MTDPEGDADRAEMDAQMDALDIKVGLAAEAHRFRTAGPERWPGGLDECRGCLHPNQAGAAAMGVDQAWTPVALKAAVDRQQELQNENDAIKVGRRARDEYVRDAERKRIAAYLDRMAASKQRIADGFPTGYPAAEHMQVIALQEAADAVRDPATWEDTP
ncbi:hypothetical protein [Catenuloplanes japonicus]|uniref:hypothetical protein n=1 Tax=Catenuloplanes japonicus TaxID=33876 RepID=UPI0005256DBA|nr:hypothetical protein [Catenuloplanes japonicus]